MKARVVNEYNTRSIKLPEKIRDDINAAHDLWASLTNGVGDAPFISFEEWYNGLLSGDCEWNVKESKGKGDEANV